MRIQKLIWIVSISIGCFQCRAQAQDTEKIYLSGTDKDHTVDWQFYCTEGRNSGKWTTIPVPSCWELQGFGTYNYGNDHRNKETVIGKETGRYKHPFFVPASWRGKSVFIVFEGSMTDTRVEVNGKLAGPIHQGAFYSFRYDISELLHYGADNLLQVRVNKVSTNRSVNESEREADYWIFGGIFRPVYLEIKPARHITRVGINALADGRFTAEVFTGGNRKALALACQIETLSGKKVGGTTKVPLDTKSVSQTVSATLDNIKTWSPEFPNLYNAVFSLTDSQGRVIHKIVKRFGFRTVELRKEDGFYINGRKIKFKGVCYHSFWPSSGRTISKDLVIRDVNLMKDMNMNAVRLSHYPRAQYFYDVCDSLGLFVADELAGWQSSYDSAVGRKLVTEMVTADMNHPSVIIWNNGNEGGYNFDLDKYFDQFDLQKRPVNHPGSIFKNINSQHYPSFHSLTEQLSRGDKVFFPDEFLHALYAGGGGASLQDYWNIMEEYPLSAGGFLWDFSDGCVVRTDKGDSLDCAGNQDVDGIVGPYREKSGSFYAIKKIWSPLQIRQIELSTQWNNRLLIENKFYFTNLAQVKFGWELISFPGPFDSMIGEKVFGRGAIVSPDVAPENSGFLKLSLPANWQKADALRINALDPHGRQIYSWTFPVKKSGYRKKEITPERIIPNTRIEQTENEYILTSGSLNVSINKKDGYIKQVQKNGRFYSVNGGPFLVGDSSLLEQLRITDNGQSITATFSKDNYEVTYSLKDDWLELQYTYLPKGKFPYYGIGFNYPPEKIKDIRWLGNGPNRVWKNRLAGAEYGLWYKERRSDSGQVATNKYAWNLPKFSGYYAGLNWAVLGTSEGPIIVVTSGKHVFLGLLTPKFGPNPSHAKAAYPVKDLSFLQAIAPIGTKFNPAAALGPMGQSNLFEYGFQVKGHAFKYTNTLWLYFGDKK